MRCAAAWYSVSWSRPVPLRPRRRSRRRSSTCARHTPTRPITAPRATGWALAATPTLDWLGGYEIGYVVQDGRHAQRSSEERVALQILSVPDGHARPARRTRRRTAPATPAASGRSSRSPSRSQYEGNGTYTITVSVGPPTGGTATAWSRGPPRRARRRRSPSGRRSSPTARRRARMVFRIKPLSGKQFVRRTRAPTRPAANARLRCARDAKVNADGSVTGESMRRARGRRPGSRAIESKLHAPGRVDVRRARRRRRHRRPFRRQALPAPHGRRRCASTSRATSSARRR